MNLINTYSRVWLMGVALTVLTHSAGAAMPRIVPHGERLRGPQIRVDAGFDLLDWNGNGVLDFYMPGGAMHTGFVHLNYGRRTEPRLGHASWYALNITETQPWGIYPNQAQIIGDLNGDGLWDMIYYDGQFRLAYNTGTARGPIHWFLDGKAPYFPGSPEFQIENARHTVTPESMYWGKGVFPRQVLTATLADWDGDGVLDLIMCRFKEQAPGVGDGSHHLPLLPSQALEQSTWLEKLDAAPARELVFYKNLGTKDKPWFDTGVEITTPDGQSIAAPNPVVVDVDGDGVLDIVGTETFYQFNGYRVDWPTNPNLVWFKRAKQDDVSRLQPAQPVMDAAGKPIPAGVCARFADYRGVGALDLFVLDPGVGFRWYQNQAKAGRGRPAYAAAVRFTGTDFGRFISDYYSMVTDWFAPGSRDLLVHGETDGHCQFGYRRTKLYRNVATRPGELHYEFVGAFTYLGDPAMVPHQYPFEDRAGDLKGSKVAVLPPDSAGGKRLVMSVAGRLYLFRKLAADGLTFQERVPLNIPNPNRNRHQGWQEIPVNVPEQVRHIRLSNNPAGLGIYMDGLLHIVTFEAWAGGKNVATVDEGATVTANPGVCKFPLAMITPGNTINDTTPSFTSFGRANAPALVTLKEPVRLDKIRFLLADRDPSWYTEQWPIRWQGKRVRASREIGEIWYHYKIEVSADGENWTVVTDRLKSEMNHSAPVFVDWNGNGILDLVLGVLNEEGIAPRDKEYRLYLNQGTNDDPKFVDYQPFCDENGEPIRLPAVNLPNGGQCDIALLDRHGDGSRYDLLVEDSSNNNSIRYYENVSANPRTELKFKAGKVLGDGFPIGYAAGGQSFTIADVDGDGVLDLLHSTGATFFFKGLAPGAPAPVADLTVLAVTTAGVEVQWTRPKDATQYELRHGRGGPILESDWSGLPVARGEYTVGMGELQTARVTIPADGQVWSLAVKSATANNEWSARSDWADAIAGPWRRVVLRNGPARGSDVVAYAGGEAGLLEVGEPDQVILPHVAKVRLRLYMQLHNKSSMFVVRFRDLPKLATLASATFELTTDPELLAIPRLKFPAQLDVTCSAVRDDWEPGILTYNEAAPGRPWGPAGLAAGGRYLDMARPLSLVTARQVLRWDVTAAVQEALAAGRTSVSLLVRGEYNGFYSPAEEYGFNGMESPRLEHRPRLTLIGKD